jgi:hypothetical protein
VISGKNPREITIFRAKGETMRENINFRAPKNSVTILLR